MSRNDFCNRVQQAIQLAAGFEKRGVSTSEGLERIAEARWSRRRFLKVTAAAVGFAVMPRMNPGLFKQSAARVVVVGGGLAGMTAAFRLQQAGIQARLFKARPRIGGRLYTVRDLFPDGQVADLGGEFIGSNDTFALKLINDLGLNLIDLQAVSGDLEPERYFFDNRQVSFAEMVEGFRPMAARMIEDINTLTGNVTYQQTNNGESLDHFTISGWMDSRGVTGLMANIVDAAYTSLFGLNIDQQSGFNLLTTVKANAENFEAFGWDSHRYIVAGGADRIVQRLAEELRGQIESESILEAINRRSDGVYVLTFNRGGSVTDVEADEVVLAIPFSALRNVDIQFELPPAKQLAIDTLGYGTQSKLAVGFTSRVWQQTGSNGTTFSDLGYQQGWDSSRGQDGQSGLMSNQMGGQSGVSAGQNPAEVWAAQFVAQLEQVFPGASAAFNGKAVSVNWADSPYSLGSRACYLPGQMTTIRGAEGEAVDGLHFAGEHTSLIAQGSINGAIESGNRAAAEVLARV